MAVSLQPEANAFKPVLLYYLCILWSSEVWTNKVATAETYTKKSNYKHKHKAMMCKASEEINSYMATIKEITAAAKQQQQQ